MRPKYIAWSGGGFIVDKKYREKVITVLGAGAVGKSIAADCALAGSRVRICDLPPYAEKSLFGIERNGIRFYGKELSLYGFRRNGTAHLEMATDNIAEAMKDAEIIVVALPCVGHKKFFEAMIPHLEDGMAVHILQFFSTGFCTKNRIANRKCFLPADSDNSDTGIG